MVTSGCWSVWFCALESSARSFKLCHHVLSPWEHTLLSSAVSTIVSLMALETCQVVSEVNSTYLSWWVLDNPFYQCGDCKTCSSSLVFPYRSCNIQVCRGKLLVHKWCTPIPQIFHFSRVKLKQVPQLLESWFTYSTQLFVKKRRKTG